MKRRIGIVAVTLSAVACGGQPAPKCTSAETPRAIDAPEVARPSAAQHAVEQARKMVRTIALNRKPTVLAPDADCLTPPLEERHLLGYRPLSDADVEVTFFLVSAHASCKASTRGRAELLLAHAESSEQTATCGAWRLASCTEQPVFLAVPSPPFRDVRVFAATPNWQEMDTQSDGLGDARRKSQTDGIPGSQLRLRHTRDDVVVVMGGDKDIDAFRAKAFIMADGVPYLVTADELVRLTEPLEHQALPFLYATDLAPTPQMHPWERQN